MPDAHFASLAQPSVELDHAETLEVALELADIGILVFPVALEGTKKTPAIADWRRNATTDESTIRGWFTNGSYVIGVPTGTASGYDVIDVDPRDGGDVWLAENLHRLPATCHHTTLQGGSHILLKHYGGMRNSVSKIAPGVDVRGDGGFVVHWPGSGLAATPGPLAPWPDWLADLALRGRARKLTGKAVGLPTRKPPTAQAVIELLDRMPNTLEVGRDTYVEVMLAAKGCIDALTEAGALDDFDAEARIVAAAVGWAERWEGGSEKPIDEAAKWDADWAYRGAPFAGWQTLTKIAGKLIPGYRVEQATAEFEATPDATEGGTCRRTPHWPGMLLANKDGAPKALLVNAIRALRYAPDWEGVLAFNRFTHEITLMAKPPFHYLGEPTPRPLRDVDCTGANEWLQNHGVNVSKELTWQALHMEAAAKSYHPVLDYLDREKWDGQPRINRFTIDRLGAEDTKLNEAYSSRFLISLVARVRQPGCKVDTVPLLEGRQGLGKSTALEHLTRPWFTDHMPDLSSKDALLQIQGIWLVEFSEMGQFSKADANKAKIFISTATDRYRAPFDRVPEDHPRQCVLSITVNPQAHGVLKDETGNRRFWPIVCGVGWDLHRQVDIAAVERDRDQLWAEADHRFKTGERFHLHEPELLLAHEASAARYLDVGPWYGKVANALQRLVGEGTVEPSLAQLCLAMGVSATDLPIYNQIGRAMTALGWVASREQRNGVRDTFYNLRAETSSAA